MNLPEPASTTKVLFRVVALAAGYALTGYAGLMVASAPGNVSSVWLPAGVALVALLVFGRRVWPGIWLGSFTLNVLVYPAEASWGARFVGAAAIASASSLGLLLTHARVARTPRSDALATLKSLGSFATNVALGAALTATGGLLATALGGEVRLEDAPRFWLTWWVGDTLGMLMLTPLVLGEGTPNPRRQWEWAAALGLQVACIQLVFGRPLTDFAGTNLPIAWAVLPAMVWAGTRLGARAVALQSIMLHGLVAWATLGHAGPFGHLPRDEALIITDGLVLVTVLTGLLLAASAAELRSHRTLLERRVHERTAELELTSRALVTETEERARLKSRLIEAEKQEALGRLAGGIAHDFNNLLTVVGAESELLLSGHRNPDVQDSANSILAATQRAAELTRQLLALARRQPSTPRSVGLRNYLVACRRLLRPVLPENVTLDVECQPDCAVLIDPLQLDQLVLNLALNARDAIGGRGGKVRFMGERHKLDQEQAAHVGLRPGDWVLVRVSDTGTGIAPEVLPRIFEPFFTTKGADRGTGLGLATVWGIANQATGTVKVSSVLGEGSTFDVWLPASAQPAEEAPTQVTANSEVGAGRTILVVEDEALVRRSIVRALEHDGYRVVVASDGEEALALARNSSVVFDLVVTDVVMPRLGGVELVRSLRRLRTVPVLFMSGFHEQHAELQGETLLTKPFAPGELAAAIARLLNQPAG